MNINKRTFVNNKLDVLSFRFLFFGDDLLVVKLLNKFSCLTLVFVYLKKKKKLFAFLTLSLYVLQENYEWEY